MAISERVDAHQTANLALPQGNRFDSENSRQCLFSSKVEPLFCNQQARVRFPQGALNVILTMDVKTLRTMIAQLPDEALVLIEGGHGSTVEARVKTGYAKEPNSSGFMDFLEEELNESFVHEAVYFYRPM
jgi:hypothetical protein